MNRRSYLVREILIAAFFLLSTTVDYADTFIVRNTNDTGAGSFRQAIMDANNRAGSDSIIFNIPISDINYDNALGVWTIQPNSALPFLTDDSTIIDGTTQASFIGSNSNPLGPEIELDGTNAGSVDGLYILSAHNIVTGLVINRFQQFGVQITYEEAVGNCVSGNYIGTDVTGTIDLGNRFSGVILYNGAKHNTIGGATEDKRNVISGNDWSGVEIQAWLADSNIVIGNYIGIDASGAQDLGNETHGINIWSGPQYNRIGGINDGEGNVISGNGWSGISIGSYGTDYNVILNNIIGMDKIVTVAIPNQGGGIVIAGNFNIVGGINVNEGNIISGNSGTGIAIGGGEGNIVSNNYIGADKTGALAFPNTYGGIDINYGAHNNIIGPGNKIHFNLYDGIKVAGNSTIANKITCNSITANTGLGINNVDGGNTELSSPSILGYSNGQLQGIALPNAVVEIFSDSADEGAIYEGTVTADGLGNFSWTGAPVSPFITVTSTDAAGNTSEFSAATTVPVELINFNAYCDHGMVILEWTTVSESNNYGFEVERSLELKAPSKEQNTGRHEWVPIGFVPGHGSATGINNYNFTDKDVIPMIYYYRLKQMDMDGNFEYYPEIAVKVENPQCASIEQNYPNPFNSETVISYQIPKPCHITIKVYNTNGQEIKKLIDEDINAGYYQILWDGKDNIGRKAPTGVYLYRIKTETYIDLKKMIMIQ